MPRIKPTDKLLSIQEKMRQLAAQEAAIVARQKEQDRKDDTRRKVIAGALALEHMSANPSSEFASVLNRLLNEYVKRPAERALFAGLSNGVTAEEMALIDHNAKTRREALAAMPDTPADGVMQEVG
jgi:hypothetical protein